MFMMSSGGLTAAHLFQGKDAILSGPAGGVVGATETAKMAGFQRVIGFDMGGTSTDVSHFDGELERAFETEVAGVRMRAPMMRIHTVAAGGGSILFYEAGRFRVGPQSAGANPGPASYRRGGPLTVTDANVMVGKLLPEYFPAIFGASGNEPLDAEVVREKFAELGARRSAATTARARVEEIADGFLAVAVENMANAIKKISVARGYDVTKYTLACFGGAGGQHACMIADRLGMETVHHPSAVGRALGLWDGARRHPRQPQPRGGRAARRGVGGGARARARRTSRRMFCANFESQGLSAADIEMSARVHVRYDGTDMALPVAFAPSDAMRKAFEAEHRARFGFIYPGKPLVAEAVEVEGLGGGAKIEEPDLPLTDARGEAGRKRRASSPKARGTTRRFFSATRLSPGHKIAGPALVIEPHQTIVVEPGWSAEVTAKNHIVLRRTTPRAMTHAIGTDADPVMLEVFNNLFMSIAEQMGVTLQNTAYSVNIKERLDFSCALFDATGALVANAPHMPVHLGSMDRSVDIVRRINPDISPGDVYALNAPYNGGTHLPDITVVTPVFEEDDERPPPPSWGRGQGRGRKRRSSTIERPSPNPSPQGGGEQRQNPLLGRLARASRRCRRDGAGLDDAAGDDGRRGRRADRQFSSSSIAGEFREAELHTLLTDHPYPCRNPAQNIADLKAQIAANEKGVAEIRKTVKQFGLDDRAGLHAPCARQRGGERAPRDRKAEGFGVRVSDRPGLGDQGEDHRRQGEALGEGRFHRHVARRSRTISTPLPR